MALRATIAVVLDVGFGEAVVAEEDFPGYPDEYDHAHAHAHEHSHAHECAHRHTHNMVFG